MCLEKEMTEAFNRTHYGDVQQIKGHTQYKQLGENPALGWFFGVGGGLG